MPKTMIEVDHVYKKFKKGEIHDSLRDLIPALTGRIFRSNDDRTLEKKEFWALNDISFKVEEGEAFGIIGHNGAGKSTILKLLSKILKPSSGQVTINGVLSALIEVNAGFHPDLTGRENVFLNGTILGMKRDEIRRKFDEIVAFSGLEDFIDTPVKRYSSGMYARLGFSVAAHVDPDILLVDEVLSVGDYLFQQKCFEKMNTIIKSGATVILISHNLKAITDICTRSILLEKGRLIYAGDTDDVVQYYMRMNQQEDKDRERKKAYVSKSKIYSENGSAVNFKSGSKVWLDVEISANEKCDKLILIVLIKNNEFYRIFDVTSEDLGKKTFSLNQDQVYKFKFEFELNLGPGTYHIGYVVYKIDEQVEYDRKFPAETIYINSNSASRGVVNINPKILESEVLR